MQKGCYNMAVRTKGRRKIICNGATYIWHIKIGYDDPYHWLHIMAEDKHLHVIIPIDNANYTDLPFPIPKAITPKFVADVIQWAERIQEERKISFSSI